MLTRTLKRRPATRRSRVDGVGGGADRTAPGSKDMAPGRRRVGVCNGAMGSPNRGRACRRLFRCLRTWKRQFYGEGRVLGSHRGLPRFKLRQVSEDPAWDAAWTEPEFKSTARPFRSSDGRSEQNE